MCILITLILPPVTAAPTPAVDWKLHSVASRIRCVQFIGDGPLWHKDTGLSDRPNDDLIGIQITDRRMIAAFLGAIHCSGRMVRLRWGITHGSIGVCLSYNAGSRPDPTGDGLTCLVEPFLMIYSKPGGSAFLLDNSNQYAQAMPPAYAARFEAALRRAVRMARHHRGHVKFFRYDEGVLAAS